MTAKKIKWYVAGLHFECTQCSACCCGPEEGVIWITKPEMILLADFLDITVDELQKNYTKKYGLRTSIIEHPKTKDCIFLDRQKGCRIYNFRPNQCRTWPFWTANLESPHDWNTAALKCPGINRGRLYNFKEIEKLRKQKNWHEKKQK
ncbi:MAG: YkgJ family cysteine cluster protein [Anaerohalosphaeraceae bacterium]|nr:YkgJ family cysteine cluster protein [Anaerohalosphaeraceae bacterium]